MLKYARESFIRYHSNLKIKRPVIKNIIASDLFRFNRKLPLLLIVRMLYVVQPTAENHVAGSCGPRTTPHCSK